MATQGGGSEYVEGHHSFKSQWAELELIPLGVVGGAWWWWNSREKKLCCGKMGGWKCMKLLSIETDSLGGERERERTDGACGNWIHNSAPCSCSSSSGEYHFHRGSEFCTGTHTSHDFVSVR